MAASTIGSEGEVGGPFPRPCKCSHSGEGDLLVIGHGSQHDRQRGGSRGTLPPTVYVFPFGGGRSAGDRPWQPARSAARGKSGDLPRTVYVFPFGGGRSAGDRPWQPARSAARGKSGALPRPCTCSHSGEGDLLVIGHGSQHDRQRGGSRGTSPDRVML